MRNVNHYEAPTIIMYTKKYCLPERLNSFLHGLFGILGLPHVALKPCAWIACNNFIVSKRLRSISLLPA